MKLEHYFRLIIMSIFQPIVTTDKFSFFGEEMSYDNQFFNCPRIYCKNGFNVSLQIDYGKYCSSENGYREFGVDWKELEFGYPSINEIDMWKYSEMWEISAFTEDLKEVPFNSTNFDVTKTVGRIPIDVMQYICDKHGGIDWDVTLSIENARRFLNLNA